MRYVCLRLSIMLGGLVLGIVMWGGESVATVPVFAQDDQQCEVMAFQAISAAETACAGLARGEICYGPTGVMATGPEGESVLLATGVATDDKRKTLAEIRTLATSTDLSSDIWGLATLMLPAGLPETTNQAVTAVLFGNAQIAQVASVESDRPMLSIFNRGGAPINLRNGAGITYDLVGQLGAGEEALADGRNEQADWVRIQFEDGMAWVFTPLIDWDDDLNTLEVLLPNDVTPSFQASGELFQIITLTTDDQACDAAPSGLLLQYTGAQTARLQVNQVSLEFSDATLFVTAGVQDALEVRVLAGSSLVTARGIPENITVGNAARVVLGGDDDLTPTAAPIFLRSYAFPEVAYTPVNLLPDPITCMVGLPTSSTDVPLRVGPGQQRGELGNMKLDNTYPVIGWANDPEGAPWWQLDTGEQLSWSAQTDVRSIGACDTVAEVEPPPLVFAAVPPPPLGEGDEPVGGPDLSPTANSVWQMVPGTDNMSGECSGAPAINFCDHLAAISPAGGGISWRGMEASPYYLVRLQPNVYAYSGPNVLGTGIINLTLTFTSETTLKMTMGMVLNSEPSCQHVYYYTGSRNW